MSLSRFLLTFALISLFAAGFWPRGPSPVAAAEEACPDSNGLARFSAPLLRMARRIAAEEPLTIVALGSSSTAGAGASGPTASYPSRLEAELRAHFPDSAVTVVNSGVNGEEAGDMLARFERSVAAYRPDVVVWQLGTNGLLRDRQLEPHRQLIRDGIARIKALGADVVIMDPQFTPKVIVKPDADKMVSLIADVAMKRGAVVFPRFAIMRAWHEKQGIPFEDFSAPDQLHMNDWGYRCIGKVLATAMAGAARVPVAAVHTAPRR
jgi:acyl-CoA thioesterase I